MIGVFDSGIGGLNVLREITKILPDYSFVYYGDSKNNPYGEKSDEELLDITSSIVDKLSNMGCRIVVIACNTATTRCMKSLRIKYPELIFIGTVPAIKVACDNNYKNTLVLATPGTIESERTSELVRDNKRDDQNIYLCACSGLANAIETNDNKKISEILDSIKMDYCDKEIDSIVLGCTHYPNIKSEIMERFSDAVILDGSIGVAKEVKHQVELNNIKANGSSIQILNSSEGE